MTNQTQPQADRKKGRQICRSAISGKGKREGSRRKKKKEKKHRCTTRRKHDVFLKIWKRPGLAIQLPLIWHRWAIIFSPAFCAMLSACLLYLIPEKFEC
jgi:hypothetical protein